MRIDISESKGLKEIERLAKEFPHFFAGTIIERTGEHIWIVK